MRTTHNHQTRKRPVNLTLSEDLVSQAKGMTSNLSAVVELLLAEYVSKQSEAHQARIRHAEAATETWNTFNARSGSFADEYSNL